MATTGFCKTAKQELAMAGHCFVNVVPISLANTIASNNYLMNLNSTQIATVGLGMSIGSSNVAAGTVVVKIVNSSCVQLSANASATGQGLVNCVGDSFYMALVKTAPARTFTGNDSNVGTPGAGTPSGTNLGTDEVTGAGYTSNGFALVNITPATGTSAAYWSFNTNLNWTTASFSATAGIIYNATVRVGHANGITANVGGSAINRMISVHDFGGTQTVTSGTFTVVLPTNAEGTAILQIS